MKKFLTVILVCFLAAAMLAACAAPSAQPSASQSASVSVEPSKSAETSTSQPASDKKIKIGITYQNLQNEFITAWQAEVQKTAKELGVELMEADGQGKSETQISQVENFISSGCTAIILYPYDMEGCAPAVDAANEAGVPIIIGNSNVSNQTKP